MTKTISVKQFSASEKTEKVSEKVNPALLLSPARGKHSEDGSISPPTSSYAGNCHQVTEGALKSLRLLRR